MATRFIDNLFLQRLQNAGENRPNYRCDRADFIYDRGLLELQAELYVLVLTHL
jgi:hypothetical protein